MKQLVKYGNEIVEEEIDTRPPQPKPFTAREKLALTIRHTYRMLTDRRYARGYAIVKKTLT